MILRSASVLASVGALLSLVAGCTAGSSSSSVGAKSGTSANAECQSPGTKGIANYSLGGPCGITGPTLPGSISVMAQVQVDPHRQLSLRVADTSVQVYGSYDQCSCAPDPTAAQNGQSYGSYQVCDPAMESNDSNITACTTTFENTVSATLNASADGTVTLQLTDGTDVLEEFSFEVASPASIDVKATASAAGSSALIPDASGVYQVALSDGTIVLETHLLTADGRTLVVGGGRSSLSARFSDSRVLASDPTVSGGKLGIKLTGAGDGSVTISDGGKLTREVKFHVSG